MAESLFVRVDEVCPMLAVSRAEAYRIIKRLIAELAAQGYIVMTGRVNRIAKPNAALLQRKRLWIGSVTSSLRARAT